MSCGHGDTKQGKVREREKHYNGAHLSITDREEGE